MAGFSFNISKGREHELHERIRLNDPVNSALILVVLRNAGLESDDVLRDYATLAVLLAASNDEPTNVGYARIVRDDTVLTAPTIDNVNNLVRLTLPNTATAAITAGDSWRKLLICYDNDTTAGTDANIVPVKAFDLLDANGAAITPNGSTISYSWPDGYHVAS